MSRKGNHTGEGKCYLIHMDTKLEHAQHYLGWAWQLENRLAQHANGTGANLLRVANERGITWRLARTWDGDRHLEKKLKNRHAPYRLCPICAEARKAAPKQLRLPLPRIRKASGSTGTIQAAAN